MHQLIPIERVESKIYLIRGQKVMLDFDLAELYGVPTKRLNEQVKRNPKRFPEDFKFSLTKEEILRMSQIATSSSGQGLQKLKYHKNINAFTEQGVAMLSSVLNSEQAIEVNVMIMRAFVKLRQILSSHKELARKVEQLEKSHSKHEVEITTIFKVLKQLMLEPAKPAKKIGFLAE